MREAVPGEIMQTPDMDLGARGYEREHIDTVLTAIRKHFPAYFATFAPSAEKAFEAFQTAVAEWRKELPDYEAFLDADSLEEYEDDPGSFKSCIRSRCPIIRRSLNSPASEMKKYKVAFSRAEGADLLRVTKNLAAFGREHMESFDDTTHEATADVAGLSLGDLLEEDYVVYGVIGGGIRSHFLYSLSPNAFPNRSRSAVWALYYLSGKRDFGFDDGSEFLMIDLDENNPSTQQNYHYPYDLFAYYALEVYKILKAACAVQGLHLEDAYRYVYLDTFLIHVADQHADEIKLLKGMPEDYYGD